MTSAAGVTVRRATPSDVDAVVALRLALLREYQDHPVYGRLRRNAEPLARDLFARQLESGQEVSFLAESGGVAIGMLRCVEASASPLLIPDRYCYVSSVFVRPEHRRRGVLRALLDRARDWCVERGLTEMRLHSVGSSASAAAAWDALGFDVVEQVRVRRLVGAATGGVRAVAADLTAPPPAPPHS